jgi:hypothetical protein
MYYLDMVFLMQVLIYGVSISCFGTLGWILVIILVVLSIFVMLYNSQLYHKLYSMNSSVIYEIYTVV